MNKRWKINALKKRLHTWMNDEKSQHNKRALIGTIWGTG